MWLESLANRIKSYIPFDATTVATAGAGFFFAMANWLWMTKDGAQVSGGDRFCMGAQMLFLLGAGGSLGYINTALRSSPTPAREEQTDWSTVDANCVRTVASNNKAAIGFAMVGLGYGLTGSNWLFEQKSNEFHPAAVDRFAAAVQAFAGTFGGAVLGDTFKHARLFVKQHPPLATLNTSTTSSHYQGHGHGHGSLV